MQEYMRGDGVFIEQIASTLNMRMFEDVGL